MTEQLLPGRSHRRTRAAMRNLIAAILAERFGLGHKAPLPVHTLRGGDEAFLESVMGLVRVQIRRMWHEGGVGPTAELRVLAPGGLYPAGSQLTRPADVLLPMAAAEYPDTEAARSSMTIRYATEGTSP